MENGSAVNLLKGSSKRKRTHRELEEVKQEEDALKEDKQAFLQEVKRLKKEKQDLEQQIMLSARQSTSSSIPASASASKSSQGPFNI